MSREAMQMALHTLEGWANYGKWVWPESALEQAKRNTTESIAALRQALETEQKTAVSPGKGTGFNYARALGITVLRPALETKQKTAVSPDGGTGFIDGVWHEPEPTAWRCQCGKPYTVTCISSKPPKKEWVGLTAYEIQEIHSGNQHWGNFACAIEAKLKEKNHG